MVILRNADLVTDHNGLHYYREHKYYRSQANCPIGNSSIRCDIVDTQIGQLIETIEHKAKWHEQVLAILNSKDEAARISNESLDIQERLWRTAKTYIGGLSHRIEFKLGSAGNIPFDDGYFDLAISTLSFHHLAKPKEYPKEVQRVLINDAEIWIYKLR